MYYECFDCRQAFPMLGTSKIKCLCGSTNGRKVPDEQFEKGFEHGLYYNIDPQTGKRTKKRPS
jgi:hypothetical protein